MPLLKINPRRQRQFKGVLIGLVLVLISYTILVWPDNESLVSLGPMNTGHENLVCSDCHVKAKGTPFQQIHANAMHALGMRKTPVTFGHEDVDNSTCRSCHDRPNDRHPVHRFLEPRFAEVREKIHPEKCESCHREHNGVRLVISDTGYCRNCHHDTELKQDPLDVPHRVLIEKELWTTCLQCHDFHGNHHMKTAVSMKDTIPLDKILKYVKGGFSPYGDEKKFMAIKKSLVEVKR